MQLVEYDEVTNDVTVKLTNVELCEIAACLGYLSNFFPDLDDVALGLPGAQGEARVEDLNNQIHEIISTCNHRYIPGYHG